MPRHKNVRLGLRGVLNSEKWEAMDDEGRRKFLTQHANEVLPKLVHMDRRLDPDKEERRWYEVTASYQLMDYHYNRHGKVIAELDWSRLEGARLKSMNIIK